jgi:LysM repeat protein
MGRLRLVERRLPRIGPRGWTLPAGARGTLARYVAPAAFLLAVTVVVLVVRAALRSNESGNRTPTTTVSTVAAPKTRTPAPKRYYVIQGGDTLDRIAARFATTVDALLRLNPGVEPTALIPGQQVRVR